ncbi:MAG: saccharopine dehydrogenase [Candidatus Neomarinimicrobiota bacterium]|nr:MAG: saccharopine dehydrogenase [Candidatus Neomarinimicrobiota bacterium]
MSATIVVLGAGLVGSAIARDLHTRYRVLAVDRDAARLVPLQEKGLATRRLDITRRGDLKSALADADLVVGAVPGFLGYATLRAVLELGKPIVDISFFPEDPFTLDAVARSQGVAAVVDCGLAPGMGNLILGYESGRMEVDSYTCYVGGLPVKRDWPWEYKAVFSPGDVIEEYTRPARFIQGGRIVTRPALSDPEIIRFSGVGSLEAWNSDGLRTLLHTMEVPDMVEKTLRYPGTIEYVRVLRESGFFSREPLRLGETEVRPLDVTAALLRDQWKLQPGEEDLTVMRIEIRGKKAGQDVRVLYELEDHFDREQGITSMARTTGYTCAAVANLYLEGALSETGILPPERIGASVDRFQAIIDYLEERNVRYRVTEGPLPV